VDDVGVRIDGADSVASAVEMLGSLSPTSRPTLIFVPRHVGPVTDAMSPAERPRVAADRLGHSLATLERLDCWRRR
jgi:hypothetical protein